MNTFLIFPMIFFFSRLSHTQSFIEIYCEFCNNTFLDTDLFGWTMSPSIVSSAVSDCGNYHLFGGYNIFSNGISVHKTIYNLVPHYQLNFSLSILKIDLWSGQSIKFYLDSFQISQITFNNLNNQANLCGGLIGEYLTSFNFIINHQTSTLNFGFIDSAISGEYYGIFNLLVNALICDYSCSTCIGPSIAECTQCYPNAYLNSSNHCSCNSSYFYKVKNPCLTNPCSECAKCDSACNECTGPLSTDCVGCSTGSKTYNGSCVSSCPPNTFTSSTNLSLCVNACNFNEFPDTTINQCIKCNSSCLTCRGPSALDCLTCPALNYLYQNSCYTTCPLNVWGNNTNYVCIPTCGASQYGDPLSRICKNCDSSCISCTNSGTNNCLSCSGALYLLNGACINQCLIPFWGNSISMTCVSECGIGYFGDVNNRICKICDSTCKSCIGPANANCSSCLQGFLENGACVSHCKNGFFGNNLTGNCELCDSSCIITCPKNFFLENGSCVSICQAGYYENSSTGICEICDSSCSICKGATAQDCLSCLNPVKYLENFICVDNCSLDLFERDDTKTCEICGAENCIECNLKWNKCKNCESNFTLNNYEVCLKNIYLFANILKNGETNIFNLSFDSALFLSINDLQNLFSITIYDPNFSSSTYNYTLKNLNNSLFTLNFTFNVNITKEVQFFLLINQTFLTSIYLNYYLNETKLSSQLSKFLICPSSFMPQEQSFACIAKNILDPVLALTFDPEIIKLNIRCLSENCLTGEEHSVEVFNHIKNNHNLTIQPFDSSFSTYELKLGESEDPTIIMIEISLHFIQSSIGNYRIIVNFNETEAETFILDQNKASLKLMDFYLLSASDQESINNTVKFSTSGSIASDISLYLNSFLQSDSSFAFRTIMIIEYIYILRYININYPINAIEMFRNKIEPPKMFLKKGISNDKSEKFLIEGIFELYEVNPYFLNNYGEIIINFFIILAGAHAFNILFNRVYAKYKYSKYFFFKILKTLHETIVWSITIIYLSSNYLNLCFFSSLNLVYRPLQTSMGLLNFSFGIIAFIGSIGFILYLFVIIKIIKGHDKSDKETKKKLDKVEKTKKENLKKIEVQENSNRTNRIDDVKIKSFENLMPSWTAKTNSSSLKFEGKTTTKIEKPSLLPIKEISNEFNKEILEIESLDNTKYKNQNVKNSKIALNYDQKFKKKSKFSVTNQPWDESPKDDNIKLIRTLNDLEQSSRDENRIYSNQIYIPSTLSNIYQNNINSEIKIKEKEPEYLEKTEKIIKEKKLKNYLEELIEKYDVIYNDFKQNTKMSHYLVIFDLSRYILIANIVVIFEENYMATVIMLLIINSLFVLYLFFTFPFREKFKNILTIITELANLLATMAALIIAVCDDKEIYDPYIRLNAGWIIVYCNIILIVVLLLSFLTLVLSILYKLFLKVWKCRKLKTKVQHFDPRNQDFEDNIKITYEKNQINDKKALSTEKNLSHKFNKNISLSFTQTSLIASSDIEKKKSELKNSIFFKEDIKVFNSIS